MRCRGGPIVISNIPKYPGEISFDPADHGALVAPIAFRSWLGRPVCREYAPVGNVAYVAGYREALSCRK
jgi:hypothetical protein